MKKFFLVLFFLFLWTAPVFGGYCQNGDKGFKSSAAIGRYLNDLAANSSGFAVTRVIGTTQGSPGRPGKKIVALLIGKNASWSDNTKPTVIITGSIHGNEWATPEVCIGIAEYLLDNKDNDSPARDDKGLIINDDAVRELDQAHRRSSDNTSSEPDRIKAAARLQDKPIVPRIVSVRELLQSIQIIIIPVLNPAGYDYCFLPEGRASYYGAGWRENRRIHDPLTNRTICYRQDGTAYDTPPADAEHCFLADYDDEGDVEEESVIVCESRDDTTIHLFHPELSVASSEMFDAVYRSSNPERVICASPRRRVWKTQWADDDETPVKMEVALADGYLGESQGVDLNRNFQYKWDLTKNQKHLFIRSRSFGSRIYRGERKISENETKVMEKLVAKKNVVALIDYHSGSTQVLYPYAYSTGARVEGTFLGGKSGKSDLEVFRRITKKIASILNRHDRGDKSIVNFTAAQNYNNTSVASGVARDCYYRTEKIAAINIEVHDKRYIYGDEEFRSIVPKICRTNVPGAVWFLFWAAGLGDR